MRGDEPSMGLIPSEWAGLEEPPTDSHIIAGAIYDFAESMSSRICELCGKPGKTNQWGWLTTACKEHRSS